MQNTLEQAMRDMGIDVTALSPPAVYEWPVPEEGQAQGVMANLTLAAALMGNVATNPAHINELQQIGVTIEAVDRAPWIVRLSSEHGATSIDVRAANESQDSLRANVGGAQGAIWVDLKAAGPV